MQKYSRDQRYPDDPERPAEGEERLTERAESVRVRVKVLLAREDVEVAVHMGQEEQHHEQAGDRHDCFEYHGGAQCGRSLLGGRSRVGCRHGCMVDPAHGDYRQRRLANRQYPADELIQARLCYRPVRGESGHLHAQTMEPKASATQVPIRRTRCTMCGGADSTATCVRMGPRDLGAGSAVAPGPRVCQRCWLGRTLCSSPREEARSRVSPNQERSSGHVCSSTNSELTSISRLRTIQTRSEGPESFDGASGGEGKNPHGGFNSYWPKPFRESAYPTIENLATTVARVCYHVTYEVGGEPTICGTGTEDYFGGMELRHPREELLRVLDALRRVLDALRGNATSHSSGWSLRQPTEIWDVSLAYP